jgi:type II secretory pathway component PulF
LPDFTYQAADGQGRAATGQLTAATRAEALNLLRAKGLVPVRLMEIEAKVTSGSSRSPRRRDVLAFTQQMATLISAGPQLDRALATVAELARETPLGEVASAVRRDVQEGAAFSAALARRPRLFNRIYVNMVKAGETGGVLPVVLRRLAQTIEEEQELRSFVFGALLYPAVVAGIGFCAVIFLLVAVVPTFARIFAQIHQELPLITRATIVFSRAFTRYSLWVGAGLAAVVVFALPILRSPHIRERADLTILRLPIFGDLYLKLATARISRTLAMLTGAGVPVLQSFAVVKETVKNRVIAAGLARAGQEIKEGGGIARRLAAQNILPSLAVQMIAVGEETGELPAMLDQVAKGYEVEVRRAIRNALALLEPVLIICLTAMTLAIAMSILIPILAINTRL